MWSVEELGLWNVTCLARERLITSTPGRQVCWRGGCVGCTVHITQIRLLQELIKTGEEISSRRDQ